MRLTGLAAIVLVAVSAVNAEDKAVVGLIGQLDSGNVAEKTKAARMLGDIGPAAADAVPALIKLHDTTDPGLRYEVVVALGRINSKAKVVVPALDHLLADSVDAVRLGAIDGLCSFGTRAQESVPHLTKLLDDKQETISVSAARAIVEIQAGKPTEGAKVKSVLIKGLKSENPAVLEDAIHGLAVIGSDAVSSIREMLTGQNVGWQIRACNTLAAIGPAAASAVNDLKTAASSKVDDVRWNAISALGELGPEAKSAVPTLIEALESKNQDLKMTAQSSLHKIGKAAVPELVESLKKESLQQDVLPIIADIGPDAAEAVPALNGLLATKSLETKREVILALAGIGEAAKPASGELLKLLTDKQFMYRPAVAYALGKIKAKEATSALKDGLEDASDPTLQLASVWALIQIEPQNEQYVSTAIPKLTKALESDKAGVRKEAIKTLGQIGPRAKSAVSALQKGLTDTSADVRRDTLIALAEIGPDSSGAVPEITRILEDPAGLRPIAIYALGRIGAASKPAIPQLNRLLSSHNPHEKTMAAWALANISPDPETLKVVIPIMAMALGHAENPEARIELAQALGKHGANSADAKDALKAALNDPDEKVRKSAETALANLK